MGYCQKKILICVVSSLILILSGCHVESSKLEKLVEIDRDPYADVGILELDAKPFVVEFQFSNTSGKDLAFDRSEPSCGCLAAKISGLSTKGQKQILEPGKVAKVEMELDAPSIGGPFEENMLVFFNQGDRSEHFKLVVGGVSEGLTNEHGQFYQYRPSGQRKPMDLAFRVVSKSKEIDFVLLELISSDKSLTLDGERVEIFKPVWQECGVYATYVKIPVIAEDGVGASTGAFQVKCQLNGREIEHGQSWQVIGSGNF